jgi:sensor histidine kinase YesM
MRNYKWQIGVPFSLVLSCVASFPSVVRFAWDYQIIYALIYNILYVFICWLFFQKIIHHALLKKSYFLACSGIAILLTLFFNLIFGKILVFPFEVTVELTGYKQLLIQVFRGLLIAGLIAFVIYYLEVLEEKQENSLELERLKQKQLEANISSLKEQLSPHFLFNSLTTLKSMISKDVSGSQDFVLKLSEVYRFLLKHKEHQMVSIKEELDFVTAYGYLLKSRFKNSLEITTVIPESHLQYFIPPLTLQLLIENAVKHNVLSKHRPLAININVKDDYLSISNNFQPKNYVENSGNVGLSNINKRYMLLAEKEIKINLVNGDFQVLIPIIK